jgi:hypothetical protein
MYIGGPVKYLLLLSDFNEPEFTRKIFEKHLSIKFDKNPSSGSRVISHRRTDRHDEAIGGLSHFW